MDLFANDGAFFSEDGKYRFALWRRWDNTKPLIMFIGLNPSTANQTEDDPTIRRVKRFASDWGFGGVYMLNLFPYVTPYPKELIHCGEFEQKVNDDWIKKTEFMCGKVICAWGNFKVDGRDKEVLRMLKSAYALVLNKDGSPRHPLYVKADIEPVKIK